MDFTDVGDLAALLSIAVVALTALAWLFRRWVKEILANLTNDDVSVAHYAHDARDAAYAAKEAALDAKDAALQARNAARQAAISADKIALAITDMSQLPKEEGQ